MRYKFKIAQVYQCNKSIMSDDSQDQALLTEVEKLTGLNFLMLVGLMASATPAMLKIYESKMEALKKRAALGAEYVETLPEDQRLKWSLAHFERLNEEIGALIRELRAIS